jgi:hypothetical protein
VAILVGILPLACGSSFSSGSSDGGDGGFGATGIPDPGPGHQVDIGFQNVLPNDTPQKATPLGTSIATNGMLPVWINNNLIGGPRAKSNYFVFRSSSMTQEFIYRGCFTLPIKTMKATLWKVVDHAEQLPPVAVSTSAMDGPGSACLDFDATVLEPNTVYLFELTATGGAGLYSL